MVDSRKYRDRIYIIKDIILTLSEYGQLNQTSLLSFCGLNLTKHRSILNELEKNGLITKSQSVDGKRTVTIYQSTQKGINFCREIIQPYEDLFPRESKNAKDFNLGCLLIV